jgi:hypothetical protein
VRDCPATIQSSRRLSMTLCSMNAGNALMALTCMNISCQSARDAITVADRRTWMLRIAVRDAKSESPSREASHGRLSQHVLRQLLGPRTRGEVALDDWALKAFLRSTRMLEWQGLIVSDFRCRLFVKSPFRPGRRV